MQYKNEEGIEKYLLNSVTKQGVSHGEENGYRIMYENLKFLFL